MSHRSPIVLAFLLLTGCVVVPAQRAPSRAAGAGELGWAEVMRLKASRDYFTLRERLRTARSETPPARFAYALVQHAFNEPAASNATIATLLDGEALPDSIVSDLRQIRMANDLRLSNYPAALAAANALLADPASLDAPELRDVRNMRRVFEVLAAVPPQTSEARGPSVLQLDSGRVSMTINGIPRRYAFDTGANLSTIMRSEAEALGLRIFPSGIDVGTSTDKRIVADLAVADRLEIGQVRYRNVVFLVLDDALLTFPDGFRIRAIIGFPVIESLGELHFGANGVLTIPETPSARSQRNLALDGLTPLTPVRWRDQTLLCRLDTGAGTTQLYEPFYRRNRPAVDSATTLSTRRMGGAGGVRELAVRPLPTAQLGVGDTTITLDTVDVLTNSIAREGSENFLDCNVGHDILDSFSTYIINFRDMAFLLR